MAPPKLLIVEDCPDSRFIAVDFFSEAGYEVLESNGVDAFRLIQKEHPDIVLLRDYASGSAELLNELRKQQIGTRIIILSRGGFPLEAAIRYLRLGVCDYWFEPFDTDEMLSSITRVLTEDCTLNLRIINNSPIIEKLIEQAKFFEEEMKKFPESKLRNFDSPYLLSKLREF